MKLLKKLKMKKVPNLLTSKEDVRKVRCSLEDRTAKDFISFVKSKHKVNEMAHLELLD